MVRCCPAHALLCTLTLSQCTSILVNSVPRSHIICSCCVGQLRSILQCHAMYCLQSCKVAQCWPQCRSCFVLACKCGTHAKHRGPWCCTYIHTHGLTQACMHAVQSAHVTMFVPQADRDGHIPAVHPSWIEPLSAPLVDLAALSATVENPAVEETPRQEMPMMQVSKVGLPQPQHSFRRSVLVHTVTCRNLSQ